LPFYYFIINIKEVIFLVFGLELVFKALCYSLKLLAEFLIHLFNLFRRLLNKLILLLNPGI
jgi:hypothetical protein